MTEPSSAFPPAQSVTVQVPATSANLGPGFDCLGLALNWRDSVIIEAAEDGFLAQVSGEGAGGVPTDRSHLVISSALAGLEDLGIVMPGLRVRSSNTIPHGRGLGSSSAAIVAGLAGAAALAGHRLDPTWLLGHAVRIEGHPDNVAPAVLGGFVLAYGQDSAVRAVRLPLAADVAGVAYIPSLPVATSTARGLLPASVPHVDAAANAARAALLVHALGTDPGLLYEATEDRLHQPYRARAMPASDALLTRLRGEGYAAVISGSGPTVLVLGRSADLDRLAGQERPGFAVRRVCPGAGVSFTA